jgi:hypothetical protein
MSFLPVDPSNPLYRILNPGMPQQGGGIGGLFNRGPSWMQPNAGFGNPGIAQQGGGSPPAGIRGLLSNPDFALALLANSGGQQKKSFGEVLGQAGLQTQQMGQQREDDAFKRRYMEAQMAAMGGKQQQGPSSVQEYEYAKKNGYQGSFQEWIVAGGQSSRPSAVQEWEHYSKLVEDDRKNGTQNAQLYLEMKRNPNFAVKDVNQVPTSIQQSIVGGVTSRPLSTLPQTAAAAETVKQAEGRGGAVGKTQGEITGGILTKGSNARSVLGMIDEAEKIVDQATGSAGGAMLDTAAAAVGKSTEGAKAIARLKVLQAGLMLNMPRMEGPQSDRDVQLYREAAASLGEPNIPRETKKAALETIRTLQQRYKERAATVSGEDADPLGLR